MNVRAPLVVVLCVACSRPTAAPSSDAAKAAAPPVAACTLATPLQPGVPGSPGHLLPSDRNPNGQSELAATMRTMQSDLEAARGAIVRGAPIAEMISRHRKMRRAWPTDPAERDEAFDAGAKAYLGAVAALESAPIERRAAAYDDVLGACRGCHERVCSGVLAAIESLRFCRDPSGSGAGHGCQR